MHKVRKGTRQHQRQRPAHFGSRTEYSESEEKWASSEDLSIEDRHPIRVLTEPLWGTRKGKCIMMNLRPVGTNLRGDGVTVLMILRAIANDACSDRPLSLLKYYFENADNNGNMVVSAFYDGFDYSLRPNPQLLIHVYSYYGWLDGLQYFVDELGSDIHHFRQKDKGYCTHLAAYAGHYDTLNYILSKRVRLDLKNKYGETCIQSAIHGFVSSEKWWLQFIDTIVKSGDERSFEETNINGEGDNNEQWHLLNIGTGFRVTQPRVPNERCMLSKGSGDDTELGTVFSVVKYGNNRYRIGIESERLYLSISDRTDADEGKNSDINECKVTLQPFNETSVNQLWNIECVAEPQLSEYAFGLNNYRSILSNIGNLSNPQLLEPNSEQRKDKIGANIKFRHRYYRISPVCFNGKYELCGITEPIAATIKQSRVYMRRGCVVLRANTTPDIVTCEQYLKGRFQFVKPTHLAMKEEPSSPHINIVQTFARYSRVMSVISEYQ